MFAEYGLLVVAIIWGMGFVASDVSLNYFTPTELMAVRFTISALCLCLIFYKHLKKIDRVALRHGIILGLFLFTGFLLQTFGLKYTTPSKNAFLTAVNVVIVPIISFIYHRANIGIHSIIGPCLALFGVGLISLKGGAALNIGDTLTLFCAVCFALHIFFTGEFLKDGSNPITLTIIQMATASCVSIIVFLSTISPKSISISTGPVLAAIYLGLVSTTLAFLLQTICQRHTDGPKAAILLSTESVFGALFSVIFLSEKMGARTTAGCIVIFAAIIITETKPTFRRKQNAP